MISACVIQGKNVLFDCYQFGTHLLNMIVGTLHTIGISLFATQSNTWKISIDICSKIRTSKYFRELQFSDYFITINSDPHLYVIFNEGYGELK